MEKIGGANFQVTYNSKDISTDISKYLIGLTYKDTVETDSYGKGEADELTLKLENIDAFWENEWYPEKGANLSAQIGYDALMNCGTFQVDEIEISSMPDVVTIKAISVPISGSLRTKKSYGHENTTLKQIVEKVAAANSLTLQGEISDISFTWLSQHMENDLSFLNRLAGQFGYYFSVRGSLLVFTRMFDLMNAASIFAIDRTDCISYSIKDKSAKVFRKANITYTGSVKNSPLLKTIELQSQKNADGIPYQTIQATGFQATAPNFPTSNDPPEGDESFSDSGITMDDAPTGDDMDMNERVENDDQAEAMGAAALLKNNTNQQEVTVKITGNPLLVSGMNFQFTGVGKLTGKYHVMTSEHDISKESGYITTLGAKRVGFIELKKAARKQPVKKSSYQTTVIK